MQDNRLHLRSPAVANAKSGILISIRRTGDGFHPGYSYNRFSGANILRCLIKGDFINIVRYGICRRREWGMKDLQWILDTAASAYEKRFMKKRGYLLIFLLITHRKSLDIIDRTKKE